MQTPENTHEMIECLNIYYGEIKPFLLHNSPFQLLVAVILSAQTTDATVNSVTPALFEKYPDEKSLKRASIDEVETLIQKINYYKAKARYIVESARKVDEDFRGIIPDSIEKLILLPGVGRKVANVVIAEIHGISPGVVVDTHVKRVSKRVGWTREADPAKVELDLMHSWPKEYWINTSKQIILIGRQFCFANKAPDCVHCPLRKWCEKNI